MTSKRVSVGLAVLLCTFALAAIRAKAADGSEADSAAVKKLYADFNEAYNKHDAHAAAILFTTDADFINSGGVVTPGRAKVEEHFVMLFAGARLKTAHRDATLRGIHFLRPDVATLIGDEEMTGMKETNGATATPVKGFYDWVVMKQDGRWLIALWHEAPSPR
jgi:uncharacterized protein (TIGR02246 family)